LEKMLGNFGISLVFHFRGQFLRYAPGIDISMASEYSKVDFHLFWLHSTNCYSNSCQYHLKLKHKSSDLCAIRVLNFYKIRRIFSWNFDAHLMLRSKKFSNQNNSKPIFQQSSSFLDHYTYITKIWSYTVQNKCVTINIFYIHFEWTKLLDVTHTSFLVFFL